MPEGDKPVTLIITLELVKSNNKKLINHVETLPTRSMIPRGTYWKPTGVSIRHSDGYKNENI